MNDSPCLIQVRDTNREDGQRKAARLLKMFGRGKHSPTGEPSAPSVIEPLPIEGPQLLLEQAMLWRTNRGPAYGVVEAAVQCLIEGLDSLWLCELAGATRESASYEVFDMWPKVAEELSLTDHNPETRTADVLASRAYVRQLLADGSDVNTIVRIISREFHYEGDDALSGVVAMEWEFEQNAYAKRPSLKLGELAVQRINELLNERPVWMTGVDPRFRQG